ncbi:uncharacterized protein EI97DRAFT_486317 [Westerdykella ornata]|uniref:UbiA prenyltransferase n=1 Tax=Westerdykella ornata TaxID=318751 RepID=A0A6A6JTD8_WESOR|nr:uncharacterized protein EI97DRAFT_486317 [Westerdykella ornata]KAF2278259.1 hypothetical protein EI97DRAFT_486317 [Westerdykella ornata]
MASRSANSFKVSIHKDTVDILNLQRQAVRFLHALHLITCDQIYDVIIPSTIFALSAYFSGPLLSLPSPSLSLLLSRLPVVISWLYLLVAQFCLHNQRHSESIEEDLINKPWRPLPSGLITQAEAHCLLGLTYTLLIALTPIHFGLIVFKIWLMYTALVLAYNEFGGSDAHGVIRNALNAGGYACFFSSSLQVALGQDVGLTRDAWGWIVMLVTALFTTFHSQDFRDEEGDRVRGRKTVISALGNTAARYLLAGAVTGWSILLPCWFGFDLVRWNLGNLGLGCVGISAAGVVGMTVMGLGRKRDRKLDARMYKTWCVWMVAVCMLPMFATF